MRSPSPALSVFSTSSSELDSGNLSADSGIASSGEESIDVPVNGGIMKKIGHRQIMRSMKLSQSSAAVHCNKELSISTTTNSVTVSVSLLITLSVLNMFYLDKK